MAFAQASPNAMKRVKHVETAPGSRCDVSFEHRPIRLSEYASYVSEKFSVVFSTKRRVEPEHSAEMRR